MIVPSLQSCILYVASKSGGSKSIGGRDVQLADPFQMRLRVSEPKGTCPTGFRGISLAHRSTSVVCLKLLRR
ncbi:MAG: hypothetical protein ABS79_08065 [Planctomycetes bacterium SCN 63-9]|nr:MAG: hypothetical protein ABS79_08065 [Planctomycetes bacterium SCN 63-9]